jgi:hypothetical protein
MEIAIARSHIAPKDHLSFKGCGKLFIFFLVFIDVGIERSPLHANGAIKEVIFGEAILAGVRERHYAFPCIEGILFFLYVSYFSSLILIFHDPFPALIMEGSAAGTTAEYGAFGAPADVAKSLEIIG